jgi:chain length determinant protein EpsF
MSFSQFLAILVAHRKTALIAFGSTVALVIGLSLVWPKTYTAVAVVVVDQKPDPVSANPYSSLTTPGFMATQVEILQSDRVALRVVRNLRLAESMQARLEWAEATDSTGSIESWLAERLEKKLDVKPSRESNLINISYKADTPKEAAFKANAFVQAYLDTNLDLRADPAKQYSSFFDIRAKQLREELEVAQAKMSAYQKEKGIIATDERLDIESARLSDLSTQLVQLQALTAESNSRKNQAAKSTEQLQDVLVNPLVASLKTDLSREEAKLKQASATLGDNHPTVIQIRASMEEIKARLAAEIRKVGSGVSVTNAINQSREADIKAALEAQRTKVLQLKEQRDQIGILMKDVENAQRAYDNVLARLSQSSLESENKLPNVAVLSPAVEPIKQSSPKMLLNSIGSVLLGLLLAVGTAFVSELRDRRIRSLEDLTQTLSLPVIGSLTPPGKKKALLFWNRDRGPLLEQRMLRPLPSPGTE